MENNKNQFIEVSISKYPAKTTSKMEWCVGNLKVENILGYIQCGYNWTNVYSSPSEISKKTFEFTQCVVIDIYNDIARNELRKAIVQPKFLEPTFWYFVDATSFKLVYCFNERLNKLTFPNVYDAVMRNVGITQDFNHLAGSAMVQINRGNPTKSFSYGITNKIYESKDFFTCEESLF